MELRDSVADDESNITKISLAAYAISAYIRSVMDPKLTRRTVSADAGILPYPRHIRGGSSGSRQIEEQHMEELDTILEARCELDLMDELQDSPLIQQIPETAASFFLEMPQLLTFDTNIKEFQSALIRLLIPAPLQYIWMALLRQLP